MSIVVSLVSSSSSSQLYFSFTFFPLTNTANLFSRDKVQKRVGTTVAAVNIMAYVYPLSEQNVLSIQLLLLLLSPGIEYMYFRDMKSVMMGPMEPPMRFTRRVAPQSIENSCIETLVMIRFTHETNTRLNELL